MSGCLVHNSSRIRQVGLHEPLCCQRCITTSRRWLMWTLRTRVSAEGFADEVLTVVTAADLHHLVSVPLSGVYLKDVEALTVGNVCIRTLSPAEQGTILETRGGPVSPTDSFTELSYTALELRESGPRRAHHMRSQERITALLAAFQLRGHHVAARYVAEHADPAWVYGGVSYNPLVLPQRPRDVAALTAQDFQTLVATANQLACYHLSEPGSAHDLALHRFVAALSRNTDADAVSTSRLPWRRCCCRMTRAPAVAISATDFESMAHTTCQKMSASGMRSPSISAASTRCAAASCTAPSIQIERRFVRCTTVPLP